MIISSTQILDMSLSANSCLRKMPQKISPAMLRMIIAYFILVRGLLMRIKIMKPTTARSIVAAVAISPSDSPNTSPQTTSAPTAKTSVSAAGSARSSTFLRKLPSMRAWFGSSASKKPGMPMVNIAIRDTCAGSSG